MQVFDRERAAFLEKVVKDVVANEMTFKRKTLRRRPKCRQRDQYLTMCTETTHMEGTEVRWL